MTSATLKYIDLPLLGFVGEASRRASSARSAFLQTLISPTPNKRNQQKVSNAKHAIDFFSLAQCEAEYIINTANRKRLNLAELDLEDLDFVSIGYRREGLFTYVFLKIVDAKTDSTLVKTGVAKRNARDEDNQEIAVKVALWRAVLSPAVQVPHTPDFSY